MEKQKKTWEKPALVVLTRNKPEEAVLLACKSNNQGGPHGYPRNCFGDDPTYWVPCFDIVNS